MNNEDGGKHTKWLNYMGPRLSLVHELLADDGICFVSINDVELFRLGLLMDEIFHERNKLGLIVWKQAADNNPTRIAVGHEYILCYAKREESLPRAWFGDSPGKQFLIEEYRRLRREHGGNNSAIQRSFKKFIDSHLNARKAALEIGEDTELVDITGLERYCLIDDRGPHAANRTTDNPRPGGYEYDVRHLRTNKLYARPTKGYRFPEETMRRLQREDRVIYPSDTKRLVQLKGYLEELRPPLRGIIDIQSRGGAADLKRLFRDGASRFPNAKPTRLLELLIDFAGDPDALILDAWAGSGTTGHAALRLNAKDGGSRRFILIEEGTPTDRYCRTVTAPRVKAAIEKEDLHGGFAFERTGRKLDRDAILELERETIANLILQTDATGTGRGLRRIVGGEYVIGQNARCEAICLCWNGRSDSTVTATTLRGMYEEVDKRNLKRPLRVYGSTCQVGETVSFRFCQIPDEILMRLSAAEEMDVSAGTALASDGDL